VARILTGADQAQSDALMRGWKQSAICADITAALSNVDILRQIGVEEVPATPTHKPGLRTTPSSSVLPCPRKDNAHYEKLRREMVASWGDNQTSMMGGASSAMGGLSVVPGSSVVGYTPPPMEHAMQGSTGFPGQFNSGEALHRTQPGQNFDIGVDMPQSSMSPEAYSEANLGNLSSAMFSPGPHPHGSSIPNRDPNVMSMLFGNFYLEDTMQDLMHTAPSAPGTTSHAHILNDALMMDDLNTPEHQRQFFVNLGITNFSREGLIYLPPNLRETAEASGLFVDDIGIGHQQSMISSEQILSQDLGLP
jgi:hypothetical protein